MLRSLLIENYALIEKLDISFDEGLTIITGETGAGKSILLGALGLILGQRSDSRALLSKSRKCIIEGTFHIEELQMEGLFEQHQLDYDPITIFRREITTQGKSRAFINDTPVNLSILKSFAERLIDIHSQHQSLMFVHSSFRYALLDAFAGITPEVKRYQNDFSALREKQNKLKSLQEQEKKVRAELDFFRFQYDELHKAALIPGELDEINNELELLKNTGTIKFNLEKTDFILQECPENILGQITELVNLLKPLEAYAPSYADMLKRLESSSIELKDIADEVARMKEDVEDDPGRENFLQERFDLLQKLMHKHNVSTVDQLIGIKEEFKNRIESFESLEEEIRETDKLTAGEEKKLTHKANELSDIRVKTIPSIEKEINTLLKQLGMPNGQFLIRQRKSEALHAFGSDDLDFMFSANLGGQPQELSKVASGGELSRLMLAVKSVISLKNLLPTIIFDEIDTGVSGEIGIKMGKILRKTAANMQVISVTHLPQVAAKGQKHYIVYKKPENQITKTFVKELKGDDRLHEIAKMLGGDNPGPAVMQAAKELVNNNSNH